MDNTTKELIDSFLSFLTTQFQADKHLKHVQLEKWSLENFRIDIKYFYKNKEGHLYVDVRELKDNKNHFSHLLQNIIYQFTSEIVDVYNENSDFK